MGHNSTRTISHNWNGNCILIFNLFPFQLHKPICSLFFKLVLTGLKSLHNWNSLWQTETPVPPHKLLWPPPHGCSLWARPGWSFRLTCLPTLGEWDIGVWFDSEPLRSRTDPENLVHSDYELFTASRALFSHNISPPEPIILDNYQGYTVDGLVLHKNTKWYWQAMGL